MIFRKKNAGKWVASKGIAVVASSSNLSVLIKKVERRKDKEKIRFDLVPPHQFISLKQNRSFFWVTMNVWINLT